MENKKTFSENQNLELKFRYLKAGLTPELFSRIHNRSLVRVYDALRGDAPALLERMMRTIERYEEKSSINSKINQDKK